MGKKLKTTLRIITVVLVVTAIYQEMRKPPEERKWHGKIFGFIPYDFRFPTLSRIRERLWNPDDPRVITERAFGIGWSINFYTILKKFLMPTKSDSVSHESDTTS